MLGQAGGLAVGCVGGLSVNQTGGSLEGGRMIESVGRWVVERSNGESVRTDMR